MGVTRRQTPVSRFSRSCTHKMNNESRPLVTLLVKDSNGKVTGAAVRCIAPNERSWFFRWLFQDALPVLLGEQSLHSMKLIMTDGARLRRNVTS